MSTFGEEHGTEYVPSTNNSSPKTLAERFQKDADGFVTATIGSKVVKFKQLRGSEVRKAESFANGSETDRQLARALFSIRSIDGIGFDPKSAGDLDNVASRFSDNEQDYFALVYRAAFYDEALEDEAKKLVDLLQPGLRSK